MKTKRTFASFCLAVSCCALITAANVSVGDQPGVVRMVSGQETIDPPVPVPPVNDTQGGTASGGQNAPMLTPQPDYSVPSGGENAGPYNGSGMNPSVPEFYSQQPDYTPYFQQSAGVTESPVIGRRPQDNPLFGPQLMFESNIQEGLGFGESYHRLNARLPYHVVPGNSVLMADLSAAISDDNRDLYNFGMIWRNYDAVRNRIFGWNAYWDMDDGRGNERWNRIGVGMESLGKYVDFRLNGYIVEGDESVILADQLIGNLVQSGNTVTRIRNQSRDNAYSGAEFEIGGPLPLLGRRGINLYTGAYWLDNDYGYETTGFSARFQALVTESATVNVTLTDDDTFGTNSWVSISYSIPNYGEHTIFQPKSVRDRLADPVYRNNRIHSNIDNINVPEAVVNAKTGAAWNLVYVDPNATSAGVGTFENPYSTLQEAINNNNAAIDLIQVTPRADDTNTNLTVNGGIDLFECQALVSSVKDYTLFTDAGQDFVIPGTSTATGLGPLISDPAMVAGGSVIRLTNGNTIFGLRVDGANAAGTVFGNGITNPLPLTDARIICNTFTNYVSAVDIQDGSGTVVFEDNTASGLAGVSEQGLVLTTSNGSMTELLIRNNTVNDNSVRGISATAGPNATINADDPNGVTSAVAQATGIVNNTVTNGGEGIEVAGLAGSVINAVVNGNTSNSNSLNGFVARTDGGTFNLASMANNTFSFNMANGAFLHYLNGGTFNVVTEDLDGDGLIDAGEDVNGNGLLDQGIVTNTISQNSLVGLCILGEDDGAGFFDIGGPDSTLGNTFIGNTQAGIAVDLRDTATAQTDALFNTIIGSTSGPGSLTIVLDFIEPAQAPVPSAGLFGFDVGAFDVTNYGFAATDSALVQNAVLQNVQNHFYNIPTVSQDSRSPIPDGMQLDIDFVIGDAGVAPSNGATEYYAINIGDSTLADQALGAVGGIAILSAARDAAGTGPNFGFVNGDFIGNVYANSLTTLQPISPANAFTVQPDLIPQSISDAPASAVQALTSGNLTFSSRAIALVTSHEIGHTLSLEHIDDDGVVTLNGGFPIMGTPAPPFNVPLQQLIEPSEFALAGTHLPEFAGDTQFVQNSIQQLIGAVGLRVAGGSMDNGIAISAVDSAVLQPSTIINNTITNARVNGVSIEMNDNAVAQDVTIQGNMITGGSGNGLHLAANGANAVINAHNTIGGTGTNTFRGTTFNQGNTITGNTGDGFRALASNGGTIIGNLLNNEISTNSRNGASLYVENGGTIDFGTAANRVISGNNISDNGGVGIELISNVSAATQGRIDAVIQGNTIERNAGGGIVSSMTGPNMFGLTNNEINLTVGGTTAQANTIASNGNVGVGFSVAGNGKGTFNISNSTITGTTDGPDPLTDGDGINLRRQDSSLLTATITNVTATGNAGDGLNVNVQGNDKNDPNQPMTGTVNTVTWSNNIFSNNGQNGADFRVQGDAQLIADATANTVSDNGASGIRINTSENSSFGDPTNGLPPGQRVVIDGTTATGNAVDGIEIIATEDSRVLTEITSNRIAVAAGAHAALNTNGDSNISGNGRDGINISTNGGSSDIVVTSGTGVTTISGNGVADNDADGVADGGNGIRWNATGTSDGTVRVTRTIIQNNIAGVTEAAGTDNNGVLDPGEDFNGNGVLDVGEDDNGDIDVADGDGIQYNVFGTATSTLVVGGVGEGNFIQNNGDDGIAITATGSGLNISRPIISIVENTIGGESSGVAAGNTGDGISMNISGGVADVTTIGADPGSIDTDIGDGNGLSFSNGVTESGPIVQLTMTDNVITNNAQRGANLLIHGAAGERDRELGAALFDPVRITMTGNTISSNGTEGVFFQGDSDMNQGRLTYLANFPFPDPPFNPADQRPQFAAFYNPLLAEFQADNVGSVNGDTAFGAVAPDSEPAYLNLRTVQNTLLTFTGNTVQNNGTGTVTGEGLVLSVGTGSYLAADVSANVFGGNLEEDVRTESFLSAGNTFDSVDDTGNTTFDAIYHDDTAQLDMRFTNNSGNQIEITSVGATYTNRDGLKEIFLGFTPTGLFGVTERDAGLFQVDDGMNLDNPNNTFVNFGITQDIDAEFSSGGFNLRAAADLLFPNIGFAPFLP